MSLRTARTIGIIAIVALAVALLPHGGDTARFVLGALSLGFLAAIGLLGYRLYMEHKFTLWSMTTRHRAMLYGGLAGAVATLTASSRLWESGFGTVMWTEIWRSDDSGVSWTHMGERAKFPGDLHGGYAQCWSWDYDPDYEWVYVVSTGFQRGKGIILRRTRQRSRRA